MKPAPSLYGVALASTPVLSLFLSSLHGIAAQNDTAFSDNAAAMTISNPLIDYKQCASSSSSSWQICLDSMGMAWKYCPSVPSLNFTAMMTLHSSYFTGLDPEYPTVDPNDCFTCSAVTDGNNNDCSSAISAFLNEREIDASTTVALYNGITDDAYLDDALMSNIYDSLLTVCKAVCEGGKESEACSADDPCSVGSHFCNVDDTTDNNDNNNNNEGTGLCKACPDDLTDCFIEGFASSHQAKINCHDCRMNCYNAMGRATVTILSSSNNETFTFAGYADEYLIQYSSQDVTGPLVDCSNLLVQGNEVCNTNNANDARDHVCFFNGEAAAAAAADAVNTKTLWDLYTSAKTNGCIAMIVANTWFSVDYETLSIPFLLLLENGITTDMMGEMARVQTQVAGTGCETTPLYTECTNNGLNCNEGTYCQYLEIKVEGRYTEGVCTACPTLENGEPNPSGCFFSTDDYINWHYNPDFVKSCATSCHASLANGESKFSTTDISVIDFGVENKEDQCFFCPNNDILYPERNVPLFGENITCDMVQLFFNRMEVDKNSQNCRLAQSVNYICGCEGTGYAGANTETKQKMLVWMPRVSAILSIMGSLFIIFNILRSGRRKELYMQIMIFMSMFDIIGSASYSFTTLPTPTDDYLYGSQGNDATCTAQGFFIQVGTVAAYMNVSLSFYYYLAITKGMNEERLRSYRLCFFLCPMVLGLAFAFAGLTYYGNVLLWCNNAAKWWPEIPIAVAIFVATVVMGIVCIDMHKKWQAFENAQQQGQRFEQKLSTKVFWQSFWYLMGFYMTWVPYLALQYSWAAGTAFTHYYFVLYAGTVVPLQGAWNCFNYARTRQLKHARELFSSLVSSFGLSRRQSSQPDIMERTNGCEAGEKTSSEFENDEDEA